MPGLTGSRATSPAQPGRRQTCFALVLVNIAWQMLLKATPGVEIAAVQDIGEEIPVAGGYTLGQVVPDPAGSAPHFLNQHIVVIVFGEKQGT